MTVPEDDYDLKRSGKATTADDDSFVCSPQTRDTYIEQTRIVQERNLSVILSENEGSQFFEESDTGSLY